MGAERVRLRDVSTRVLNGLVAMARQPAYHKRPWKPEEDAILAEAVAKFGCPDKVTSRDPAAKKPGALQWSQIAAVVPNRVAKQCRERWRNHLDPAVSREDWSPEEEATLLQRYIQFNGKWSEISKDMPGRPDNACKNQWNKLNGKGRYVIPAGKKKPPATGVMKRSHHKKSLPGTLPRKRSKFVVGKTEENDMETPVGLKVLLVSSGTTPQAHSELAGDLRYQQDRDYYSGDSEATQVGRSSEDYSQYREQHYDVEDDESDESDEELTGFGTGTSSLEGFRLGQETDSGHDEIPASGDGHVPAPFAWTDPQLPVEEPVSTVRQIGCFRPLPRPSSLLCAPLLCGRTCALNVPGAACYSQDDPEGAVNEVMSTWDREAAAKSGQGAEREDDTPQADRRTFGSSGSGSEAPLRLDMSTDFFANVSAMLTAGVLARWRAQFHAAGVLARWRTTCF